MCYRVAVRMACPECSYPESESLYPLYPNVPHTTEYVGEMLRKMGDLFQDFEETQMMEGGQDLSFVECTLELTHFAEELPHLYWVSRWGSLAHWSTKKPI